MAKTITTQYGEFLNYDNLVRIGIVTNWEDAEPDENGIVTPDYEMVGTDTSGNQIPMGNYKTPEAAEAASQTSTTGCLPKRMPFMRSSLAVMRNAVRL